MREFSEEKHREDRATRDETRGCVCCSCRSSAAGPRCRVAARPRSRRRLKRPARLVDAVTNVFSAFKFLVEDVFVVRRIGATFSCAQRLRSVFWKWASCSGAARPGDKDGGRCGGNRDPHFLGTFSLPGLRRVSPTTRMGGGMNDETQCSV